MQGGGAGVGVGVGTEIAAEGAPVGLDVGVTVGVAVGVGVVSVGASMLSSSSPEPVGSSFTWGLFVGVAVGVAVGLAVGIAVGASVGAMAGGKVSTPVEAQHTLRWFTFHDSFPTGCMFQYTLLFDRCRQHPRGCFFEVCTTSFLFFSPKRSNAYKQAPLVSM